MATTPKRFATQEAPFQKTPTPEPSRTGVPIPCAWDRPHRYAVSPPQAGPVHSWGGDRGFQPGCIGITPGNKTLMPARFNWGLECGLSLRSLNRSPGDSKVPGLLSPPS